MSKMNRDKVNEISEALKELMLRHFKIEGVQASVAGGAFNDSEFTVKVKFRIEGSQSAEESALRPNAKMDGINHLGIGAQGERLVEYQSRKRKYPYIYTKGSSKYKCTAEHARELFGSL